MATNINRNVKVQALGDAWKAHARMVPVGFTPLGTVVRAGRVHAFARDAEGNYWIFGDGRPEMLPQAKIQRAIGALSLKTAAPVPGPDAI